MIQEHWVFKNLETYSSRWAYYNYRYSWGNLKTIGQIIEVFEVMKTT